MRTRFSGVFIVIAASVFAASAVAGSRHPEPAKAPAPTEATASATPDAHTEVHAVPTAPTGFGSATVALAELISGNQRYTEGRMRHANAGASARKTLANGQAPKVIVLSCADSRVPPEIVFDRGLGELFVVRVAGNVLDHASVASIEYAVEHLHAPLLVVMGHSSCGAVKAALTVEGSAGSADLDALIAMIRPNLPAEVDAADTDIRKPVKANVNGVVAALAERSPIVRGHLADGRLVVVPAMYRLDTGVVDWWDPPAAKAHAAR